MRFIHNHLIFSLLNTVSSQPFGTSIQLPDIQINFNVRTCFQGKDGWLPVCPITTSEPTLCPRHCKRLLQHPPPAVSCTQSALSAVLHRASTRCENAQLLKQDAKQMMLYFRKDLQSCVSSGLICGDVCRQKAWAYTKVRREKAKPPTC